MAFKFIVAVFSVLAVASQANGSCLPLAPPCAFGVPPPALAGLWPSLLGGCAGPLPAPLAGLWPNLAGLPPSALAGVWPKLLGGLPGPLPAPLAGLLPNLLGALGPAKLGLLGLPAGPLPCLPTPTSVANKPDVNIPLPLPAEIPVGRFCACQKFAIKPTLLPCAPVVPPLPFRLPGACACL